MWNKLEQVSLLYNGTAFTQVNVRNELWGKMWMWYPISQMFFHIKWTTPLV